MRGLALLTERAIRYADCNIRLPFAGTGLKTRSPVASNSNNAYNVNNVNNDGNLNNNDVNNTGAAVRPDSPHQPETRIHADAVRACGKGTLFPSSRRRFCPARGDKHRPSAKPLCR